MSLFDATWSLQAERLLPPVVRAADLILNVDDIKGGDSENQHIHYLIASSPGHWKEFPPVGVGIWKYLQSTASAAEIQRAIRVQLTSDVFPRPLIDVRGFPTIIVNSVVVELE